MEIKKPSVNYKEIFLNAWQVSWQNRYLWWFGLFLALGGGGSYFNYSTGGIDEEEINQEQIMGLIKDNLQWIIIAVLVILVLYLIFSILAVWARGALIASIDRHAKGKPSDFKMGLKDGRRHFWKILWVAAAIGMFFLATIVILGVPIIFLFMNENYVVGIIMTIFAFTIILALAGLSIYMKAFSYLYIVLGKLSFWPALENSYSLFQKRFSDNIVMGLLFIPLGFVFMVAVVSVALAVAIVFVGFGLIAFLIAKKAGAIVVGVLALATFVLGALVVESFYKVFTQAVWYYYFQEIAKAKEEEKVVQPVTSPAAAVPTKVMTITEAEK